MAWAKPPKRSDTEKKAFAHYAANPVEAVKDWFKVTPDPWQGDLLNGLFTSGLDRVAAKAAHGVGKSAVDAWAGWLFLNVYENSRLVATAPTFAQLHDVLFPEFAKWHAKMPQRMKDEWNISGGHIRHKGAPYEWFGVARTSNKPANLQGFHGEHLMIIGDEASAIPENVFEVIEGALSEAGDDGKIAKLLLNGNPNYTTGELYNAFNRNKDLYYRITITGDPDFAATLGSTGHGDDTKEHGHLYYSPRVKPRYVSNMARKYGLDSAVFDVRVKGIFPRAADDAVIPFEWAQRASMLALPDQFDKLAHPYTLIVDVSRGGGAETVIGYQRRGVVIKMAAFKTTTTTQIVNHIQEARMAAIAEGTTVVNIIIDEPGVGGGVIDQCRALNMPITPYHGGKALVRGEDPEEDIRMFANRKSRDWWNLRRLFEQDLMPIPDDEVLVNQLASVKFTYNKQEKIAVEGKEDLKNRLGKEASPDRADVIVMACAPNNTSAGVAGRMSEEDFFSGEDRPQMEMDL
jgi:phage terminase large subunit